MIEYNLCVLKATAPEIYKLVSNWILTSCQPQSVSKQVGAFSPVNHEGLYPSWKQASTCLLVILRTSHKIL